MTVMVVGEFSVCSHEKGITVRNWPAKPRLTNLAAG